MYKENQKSKTITKSHLVLKVKNIITTNLTNPILFQRRFGRLPSAYFQTLMMKKLSLSLKYYNKRNS